MRVSSLFETTTMPCRASGSRFVRLVVICHLIWVNGKVCSSLSPEPKHIDLISSATGTADNDAATLRTNANNNNHQGFVVDVDDAVQYDAKQQAKLTKAAARTMPNNNNNNSRFPRKVISLAESIKISIRVYQDPQRDELRKQYWERTFDEIRNLTVAGAGGGWNGANAGGLLSQWKLLLEDVDRTTGAAVTSKDSSDRSATVIPVNASSHDVDVDGVNDVLTDEITKKVTSSTPSIFGSWTTTRRFEGFPSWERMVQDWADDVQEYLDKVNTESESGYSIGNFGRPAASSTTTSSFINATALARERENITNGAGSSKSYQSWSQTEAEVVVEEPFGKWRLINTTSRKPPSMPKPTPAQPGEAVLPHTDISDKSKRILVVTTASLPWRTGTAVNPLLRAAYLTRGRKEAGGSVTLMLPWLERKIDQERVYGSADAFPTPNDQETYIRSWLRDSANMLEASEEMNIQWYTAWQNKVENSIYSMGDITALISADDVDICILEEPEHLNWYRAPGEHWTKKFKHVVGILHTNYFAYALDQPAAIIRAPAMRLLCSWMCRAHCHRVIKLSGTLDPVAPEKELVENVHGVRGTFLDTGKELRRRLESSDHESDTVFSPNATPTVYFIGKMLWSKGLGSLMELLKFAEESADLRVSVDMFGGGPDESAADIKAQKLGLKMIFQGPLDHSELAFTHKVFVNPSTSEVLCTTTAEALAMGKFVIVPSHPSNDFFAQFPNCLAYATKEEFVGYLYYALTHSPAPLTDEYAYALTWEAATERLEAAGCIPAKEAELLAEALASEEAGMEIPLPTFVESEQSRKALSTTLRYTRALYRQVRKRLSNEIQQSRVLPKPAKERLVSELDKRLDLNIDEILESPKLRLKLSPAEVDKTLLELYDKLAEGPGGDVLRIIGGGGPVALQHLYMKRKASRERWRGSDPMELFPSFVDEFYGDEGERTTTQWVRWALRQNIPTSKKSAGRTQNAAAAKEKQTILRMCFTVDDLKTRGIATWEGFRPSRSFSSSFCRPGLNGVTLLV